MEQFNAFGAFCWICYKVDCFMLRLFERCLLHRVVEKRRLLSILGGVSVDKDTGAVLPGILFGLLQLCDEGGLRCCVW